MAEQILDGKPDLLSAHRPPGHSQNPDDGTLHHAVAEPPRRRLHHDVRLPQLPLSRPDDSRHIEHRRQGHRGV
jgi:hypothetical protein